jgi:hypothetical protein
MEGSLNTPGIVNEMIERRHRFSVEKILLLFTILFACLPCLKSYGEENWKKLGENEVGVFFYDASSLRSVEPGVVTVRVKMIVSEDTAESIAKALPGAAGLYQLIDLNVIDCKNDRYFLSRIIFYDKHGKVLHDSGEDKKGYTPDRYRPILEDTPIGSISQEVCATLAIKR